MLKAVNLCFGYDKKTQIVNNFNLEVQDGEIVGLTAPSGHGKSTISRLLACQLKPDSGYIEYDGEREFKKNEYYPVQLICQNPETAVNPRMKMKDILNEGYEVPDETLRNLGIRKDWLSRYPSELSGGELQRFCIARALGPKTKYLIADEISTMLDANTQALIWEILLKEVRRRNISLIVITHSEELAKRVCDRIIEV